jgi:hypothetical protein
MSRGPKSPGKRVIEALFANIEKASGSSKFSELWIILIPHDSNKSIM